MSELEFDDDASAPNLFLTIEMGHEVMVDDLADGPAVNSFVGRLSLADDNHVVEVLWRTGFLIDITGGPEELERQLRGVSLDASQAASAIAEMAAGPDPRAHQAAVAISLEGLPATQLTTPDLAGDGGSPYLILDAARLLGTGHPEAIVLLSSRHPELDGRQNLGFTQVSEDGVWGAYLSDLRKIDLSSVLTGDLEGVTVGW
jgi:hypothetical protein